MVYTTITEENYLKAIYKHSDKDAVVATNTLSVEMRTTPASVTDMIKRLSEKALLEYTPYRGVVLTELGRKVALTVIRKHRLWEVFLVEKLKFTWDEVHEAAEELEHIRSQQLIRKLDEFLGFPRFDPHGDPIPDEDGVITPRRTQPLTEIEIGREVLVAAVLSDSTDFLQYLDRLGLHLGVRLAVSEKIAFDDSRILALDGREVILNNVAARNILVANEADYMAR